MILAIILAVIFLLILLVLIVPVNVVIQKDSQKLAKIYVKILFLSIGDADSTSPIIKKITGKFNNKKEKDSTEQKKEAEQKEKKTSPKSKTNIGDTIGTITRIIKEVIWLFKRVKLKKLFISYIGGGDDPAKIATDYGIACATIYPLLGYVSSITKVDSKKVNIDIKCDFERESTHFDFDIVFSIRIIFGVFAAIRFLINHIKNKIWENK